MSRKRGPAIPRKTNVSKEQADEVVKEIYKEVFHNDITLFSSHTTNDHYSAVIQPLNVMIQINLDLFDKHFNVVRAVSKVMMQYHLIKNHVNLQDVK